MLCRSRYMNATGVGHTSVIMKGAQPHINETSVEATASFPGRQHSRRVRIRHGTVIARRDTGNTVTSGP